MSTDSGSRMRAFRVAYDGRPFHGFQRQPAVPTVEDALFDAVDGLGVFDRESARKPDGYAAAGRTDAGVSALAQTVAFRCPAWCTPRALNGELPSDIRAWAAADVAEAFHATHDAERRAYVYDLYGPDLDDGRITDAAAALSGAHDFHNLTSDDDRTEREISVHADRDGEFVTLHVAAGGFPRQLVRRVASVIRAVGSGERELGWIGDLLGPEALDGPEGVPPAPPEPLLLADVSYPKLNFDRDARAVESAAEIFAARRREHLVRARVAGRLVEGVTGSPPE